MRLFPNMVVMAPGDELDVAPMLRLRPGARRPGVDALSQGEPGEGRARPSRPVELGQAEVLEWGDDGMLVAYGTLFPTCVKAAEKLREEGLDVGVINARFAKPLDQDDDPAGRRGAAAGGHGRGGHAGRRLRQRGAGGGQRRRPGHRQRRPPGHPDRFVEHAERGELLADLGLDVDGICRTVRTAARETQRTLRGQRPRRQRMIACGLACGALAP